MNLKKAVNHFNRWNDSLLFVYRNLKFMPLC
ncbi:TPA: hypothetical protein PIX85_001631 [Staphylococcus aureus]|nr:hypothetical protein [Staphylococcus aureus]MBU6897520.1 hypothetical protein [Staphylococcus aureus]HCX2122319.1 hypothetical protein [Staphylococcus aureus]HCX3693319.1 hypothetical protein [Staphylococcus aureus]HDH4187238.1 hypothetical protein [Staphylococcus aureus]